MKIGSKMDAELLAHLDKLHTTALGAVRIKRNLKLDVADVVMWCREKIEHSSRVFRRGKNWYVYVDSVVITVNVHSFTIITAHKEKIDIFEYVD